MRNKKEQDAAAEILIDEIKWLRSKPLSYLSAKKGFHTFIHGGYEVVTTITRHVPYPDSFQFKSFVTRDHGDVLVETIFYRSE